MHSHTTPASNPPPGVTLPSCCEWDVLNGVLQMGNWVAIRGTIVPSDEGGGGGSSSSSGKGKGAGKKRVLSALSSVFGGGGGGGGGGAGVAYQMAAKGMLFVIGDADRLLDGSLGTFGEEGDVLNRFEDMGLTVFDFLKYPEVREEILPCFLMDKAMVFCGKTGRILGNKFGIKSIAKGIKTAGTKLQAASAISQEDTVANKWWVDAPYSSSCPPT